jgi:hypothetical protein
VLKVVKGKIYQTIISNFRPTTALLYAISCYDGSTAVSVPMIKLLVRLNADVRVEGWSFLFRDRFDFHYRYNLKIQFRIHRREITKRDLKRQSWKDTERLSYAN